MNRRSFKPPGVRLALLVMSLATPGASAAQDASRTRDAMDEPLVTDRPDFTESVEAVPAGHVQLEAGYTFAYDREGKDRLRDHSAPELLLRIGVAENVELRIGWNGYSWTESQFQGETRRGHRVTRTDWTQGAQDLSLGFKYKFAERDGLVPDLAVLGALAVPSGSRGASAGDVDPELLLLWAYDVTHAVALAGSVGVAGRRDGGDQFVQTFASMSVALTLTERLGGYVEYFGFYPNTEHSDAAHFVNGGLTYLIDKNFQIDGRIGAGLNEEADDFFIGVGFAWRL
ncbi:MAG: transporter [Phycisphaerae bacterium]